MAASGRSVPRSIAPVLEALELEQPTLVTQRYLEKLIKEAQAPRSAIHAARTLRKHGWLLPLRTPGVWEFAPAARAGARGGGDPFIELRARLATRPIETAVAAESAAWLQGLSTRAPERHAIALPPGASLPQSLDGFRVVRWRAADPVANSDTLPLWSVTTLIAFMGTKPQKYRDWPNVSEWLADGVARVSTTGLRAELAGHPKSAWSRTSYLLFRGGRAEDADALFSSAPPGHGPFHFGAREMRSKYVSRFELIDHVFPTWWSIKAKR